MIFGMENNNAASKKTAAEQQLFESIPGEPATPPPAPAQVSTFDKLWGRLVRLGLGETTLRVGTGVISVLLAVFVLWVMSRFLVNNQVRAGAPAPTEEPVVAASGGAAAIAPLTLDANTLEYSGFGIPRLALLHTDRPADPRSGMEEYTILAGDTIFGIAEKFGLQPQTILWSNRHILGDDPHNIYPGVTILIPPIDGAVYQWNTGDGLNGVSKFYNVTPDVIIDWPANQLSRATLGDLAMPNIEAGTLLFIPGGKGAFTDWLPMYTREEPAKSSISGSACGVITYGYIGSGTFVWPTVSHELSGFDYSPETNHKAIDIGGALGSPVYAVDAGVVVYSNWNEMGYGNLIVIDHGNGWQSVYAHLDNYVKFCGENVEQGEQIGMLGSTGNSTGPHLHFELRNLQHGAVNPWDFLP